MPLETMLGRLGGVGIPSLKKMEVKLLNTAGISGWRLQSLELKRSNMNTIYNLTDTKDNSIFYVGVTANPKKRLKDHLICKSNKSKYNKIQSVLSNGFDIKMNVLKEVEDRDLAEFIESEYIDLYSKNGINLLNMNSGGNTPPSKKNKIYTAEQKLNSFVKSPLKKTVYQVDKNDNIVNVFLSTREAGRLTGIDYRSISQVANGSLVRKTAGGFKWLYK
jgi:predicted GIY-YIG superfamily endonuclease